MAKHIPLNNIQHKDLKIITRHGADLDDNVTFAVVFPHEFKRVQGDYPIFFRKIAERDTYEAISLFGFEEFENLFVDENGWNSEYIPITVRRRPFTIGFQPGSNGDESPVVFVDMDSPRVSETEGERVFLEHGGHAPHFEKVTAMLQDIFTGNNMTTEFAKELEKHKLLEDFTLTVDLEGEGKLRIGGFSTINEDKFHQLSDEVLGEFHRKGYLAYIYMMFASINNIHRMSRLKKLKVQAKNKAENNA